jgi:hypothetical protein
MGARDLFDDLKRDGWTLVQDWVTRRQEETLHLEFKNAEHEGQEFGERDRKNLARELSAFANTEGGVLVFGIKSEKDEHGVDRADELKSIRDVERFAALVRRNLHGRTEPPVTGTDLVTVESPTQLGAGIVAVYVPESYGGPHRASGCEKDVSDKYYGRREQTTGVLAHRDLIDRFSARAPPKLNLHTESLNLGRTAMMRVCNSGRGIAEDIRVKITFDTSHPYRLHSGSAIAIGADFQLANGWRTQVCSDGKEFVLVSTRLLYPEEDVVVCGFSPSSGSNGPLYGSVRGRIDCRNAQPVHFDVNADLLIAGVAWLPPLA